MITYNDIYEAARKERYSDQLQPLPKNFVTEVSNYLQEKKQMSMKETDEFSDVVLKAKKQLENAKTFFNELIVRRRKKILSLGLIAAETGISKQDFENMFAFEKEFFEELMKCMNSCDKKLSDLQNGKKLEQVQVNELIIFKKATESFLGLDAKNMGPFEKGQIANIPKEIAKILIEGGKAEKVYE
jgi:DNA replication initiation complex subunit (GINS family)